jgi:hypothetical protein
MMESEVGQSVIPPSDESTPKSRGPNYRRREILLGVIVITVFVVLIVSLAWDYSVCPLIQVVPSGTSISIAADSHVDYGFNVTKVLNADRSIYGSLTSSGPVVMYVTTADQLKYWTPTGPPGPYEYNSGPATSLKFCNGKYCGPVSNLPFAPLGHDYLVLRNPGQTSILVVIGTALVVQSC